MNLLICSPLKRAIQAGSLTALLALATTFSYQISAAPGGNAGAIPDWNVYEISQLDVKFREGTRIRFRNGKPKDLDPSGAMAGELDQIGRAIPRASWRRGHSVPEEKLARLRGRGLARSGRDLPDLDLYERLTLPLGLNAYAVKQILMRSRAIEGVYYVPKPPPPPAAPDYSVTTATPYQNYLDAAPNGIDARNAWSLGRTGQGISICDVEYDFNDAHVDLPRITRLGDVKSDPFNSTDHGTAVFGEMVGLHDASGVRGVAYGAGPNFFAPANTATYGYSAARALVECIAALEPGDVILIEQQTVGPNFTGVPSGTQFGLVPTEWNKPVYDAIRTAVANDIVVVETSGNGSQNLDAAVYSTGNDNHWPFLPENDSGAIIVTGGSSTVPHGALGFTNSGATVDLQGWGGNIVTTGYGDLYSTEGINSFYTQNFGGSSGAGPMVAGAVAALQSGYKALSGTVLPAAQVRSILRSSGTPGSGTLAGAPLPNLQAAINNLTAIYVDRNATGSNNGTSWANAYTWLPDALAAANAGNLILVAKGDYFPAFLNGPRTNTFQLKNGVAILGGFPSGGGTRDPKANITRLSGNIDSNPAISSANDSYHVVTGSNTDATAILDGFVIAYANADGTNPHERGAGIYIENGSPTIRNTVIEWNKAALGAGAYISGGSASFIDLTFANNTASGYGGGIYNSTGDLLLNRVAFVTNHATGPSAEGGGFFTTGNGSAGTTPLAYDLRFYGNTAFRGGALANWLGSELRVDNAIFSGNSATDIGGGVSNYLAGAGSLRLHNATFANNQAPNGGGAIYAFDAATLKNSILWGNSTGQLAGPITVTMSVVQGGVAGTDVTTSDPVFRDANGSDNSFGTADDDLRLAGGSPAIDSAGADCTGADINGYNRIGTCDRGAHEYLGDPGTFWSNGEVDSRFTSQSSDQTLTGAPIRQAADDFTIPAGQACDVTSVRSVLADPTGTIEAKLDLYDDANGHPGTLLEAYAVGNTPGTSLGSLLDAPMWQYRFDIPPLRLQAGTYWVSVYGEQESSTTAVSAAVSAGEGVVKGHPHQFREAGFAWVDGGVFHGHGSHDLALDVDATCGCATNGACDDANPDTLDSCSNLVCSNIVPSAPANDNSANAIAVSNGVTNGTLLGASNDGSSSQGTAGAKDVWYTFTAAANVQLLINTCGTNDQSGLDTVLSVYAVGPGGVPGTELVANDDWPTSTTDNLACSGVDAGATRDSALRRTLSASQTVYIRVSQFSSDTNGNFVLNVSTLAPAVVLPIPALGLWGNLALGLGLAFAGWKRAARRTDQKEPAGR